MIRKRSWDGEGDFKDKSRFQGFSSRRARKPTKRVHKQGAGAQLFYLMSPRIHPCEGPRSVAPSIGHTCISETPR